ncbi:hypothetical protein ACJMK2_026831 [Sinanodonta woodiana]|uniref:Uncharacterized protein n=1 Tax=Sinanodonta woodiana TaxID=1069815 RepID=A0ABD3XPG6_SINWO
MSRTLLRKNYYQKPAKHIILKAAERSRLVHLFRNAHAVAKNNHPLSDYTWLCEIDKAKQLDIGSTYIHDKAATDFIHSITHTEKQITFNLIEYNPVFAFMMDGSTDISGDEQGTIYIRTAMKGVVKERFLNISIPNLTVFLSL